MSRGNIFMEKSLVNNYDIANIQRLSSSEMNLLLLLSIKLNYEYNNKVIISFNEMVRCYKLKKYNIEDDIFFQRIQQISFRNRLVKEYDFKFLFISYKVDILKDIVIFTINPELIELLSKVSNDFNYDDIELYFSTSSSYVKTALLLIGVFETKNKNIINIENFRKIFDIPKKYQMSDIDKKVLNPIRNKLEKNFSLFKIEKIISKKRYKVDYLKFEFERKGT